jgi:hypothetical protein
MGFRSLPYQTCNDKSRQAGANFNGDYHEDKVWQNYYDSPNLDRASNAHYIHFYAGSDCSLHSGKHYEHNNSHRDSICNNYFDDHQCPNDLHCHFNCHNFDCHDSYDNGYSPHLRSCPRLPPRSEDGKWSRCQAGRLTWSTRLATR